MRNRFFLQASNVHQGGGRSLLSALLNAVKGEIFLCVDDRMPLQTDFKSNMQVRRVKPSIIQRLLTEKWLAQVVEEDDVILCFGNLPPLFRLKGHTVVFVQNRYLIEDVPLNGFPLRIQIRLSLERLWLARKLMNSDEFIVQTPTMKKLLDAKTQGKKSVRVLPFVADPSGYTRNYLKPDKKNTNYDFVYVASGEPHKNHRKLIEAWCLLAVDGLFPTLCLTLDRIRFFVLSRWIEDMIQQYGLKVSNLGELSHDDVLSLYEKSAATIYPSKFESFGLPLIEARKAGLPVLASELDFVRDVLDPEQVFDPDSSMSIARAVKRYMDLYDKPLTLLNAEHFLATVFKKEVL
jgi:glycosyltransferase involved in cell wall biosynthesis